MKKTLILLLTILTFNLVNAQWETKFYVDEFGDATTQEYEAMQIVGTFSNSATQNSKATYSFIKDKETVIINVYEYSRTLANSIEATFETVKLKTPNGIETIERVYFTKAGALFFNKKEYDKFISIISNPGNYTMIFNRTGDYSNSSYKIKFTIK